jgi:amino acid transporter
MCKKQTSMLVDEQSAHSEKIRSRKGAVNKTMQKKIKLTDIILAVICIVFVAEAAAPVAALGNSQFFWWMFMIVAFLLPYGLISSELGTTYQGDGGLYDWINQAYPGTRWGARAAWWYWLNFPLWMASLAVMVPDLLAIAFDIEIGIGLSLALQLGFILIVTIIACYPVCDSVIILNICAVIKVCLALLVGGMGIYFIIRNGFVNDMSFKSFLPSFDLDSLSVISVIIFNMLGFEVVCTFSNDMKNPKKEIPQAIVIGGLVIAAVYLFGGFGIGAGIPADEVDAASGLIESVMVMSGREDGIFIAAVALMFLVTLFGNMISWSLGINNTACYAAENGDMPAAFTKRWAKNDMPVGSAIINGVVAAIICVLGVVMTLAAPESKLFWTFFAMNLILLLMSYLPIFPAFLKLRKSDPDAERPFKVPGGPVMLKLMTWVPFVLIVISVLFCAVPLSFDAETLTSVLPITIGAVICIVIGEVLTILREKKDKK